MLRCAFGWGDVTTKAFQKEEIDWLELRGAESQPFNLPPLGHKVNSIKRLLLVASGEVSGLGQFTDVPELDLSVVPKNGIDLSAFRKVSSLRFEWDKLVADQVLHVKSLRELDLIGYAHDDCVPLRDLSALVGIGFTQGKLKVLKGFEHCPKLRELSLSYLRGFNDLAGISRLGGIETLSLTNLPKLSGVLEVSAFPNIHSLYVVDSSLSVDLSGLERNRHLAQLWLNVESENLHWDALFSRPLLRRFGVISAGEAMSDEEFSALAKKHGRSIAEIRRVGRRKSPQIQVIFSSP